MMHKREYSFSTFITTYLVSLLALLVAALFTWIYISTNHSLKEQQKLNITLNKRNSSQVLDTAQHDLLTSLSDIADTIAAKLSISISGTGSPGTLLPPEETLSSLDLLRFIPVGDLPAVQTDSPFYDFSNLQVTDADIASHKLGQCWLLQVESVPTPLFLLVANHRIIEQETGKVLGHLVGGIVLNNNLALSRDILQQSNAKYTALQAGETLLATSAPLPTELVQQIIEGKEAINRITASVNNDSIRLLISRFHYSFNGGTSITVVLVYQDTIFKEMQKTFITSGLFLLLATAGIFLLFYRLSRRKANQALTNLVSYTNQVIPEPESASYCPGRLAEFNLVGNAIQAMVSKINRVNSDLKATKEQLELVITGADLGTWDWEVQTGAALFNERWAEMLGYHLDELEPVEATWNNSIHPEDRQHVIDVLEQHLQGLTPSFSAEHRLKHKTGHWVWVYTAGRVYLRDDIGTPLRASGIHLDVTMRKDAEAALARERALLLSMINSIPDLIFYKDKESVYLGCNTAFERFVGKTADEITGRTDYDLFPSEVAEFFRDKDRSMLAAGKPQRNEEWVTYPDGHRELLDTLKTPFTGPDQSILGLIGVSRDITLIKETEKKLADERERLSVTLRSIGEGVIATDISGNVVLMNTTAEKLTGWTNEEAEGLPSSQILNIINEKTGEQAVNPAELALRHERIVNLEQNTILISRDGRQRKIAESGAPIHDRQSVIIGAVIVFRDITAQQWMEEEVLKARKLESIGILAGGIAHDFNNILSAILGNLELAAALLSPQEEKALNLLTNAQKATSRAAKLTQQLLTFSKGGDPVKEATSLPLLITESADFVLHGSHISCVYDFPEDLWLADADTGQLSQVIQNITLNAKHAMPSGGVIQITAKNIADTANEPILGSREKQFIKICITDSGIGISPEILDKVFDPYFTTKQEGSGLGLAISHSIIRKHDGQLTVQSHPGQGTTFSIFIPRAAPAIKAKAKSESSNNHHRPLRVMVMDDEEMIRSLVSDQLKILGHEPFLAEHGEEALQQYKVRKGAGSPLDIVIMDLTIRGGMGGMEASKRLLEFDPDARLIVASGYSNDPVISHFQDYGIRAAIIKPFNITSLEKAICTAMLSEPKSA